MMRAKLYAKRSLVRCYRDLVWAWMSHILKRLQSIWYLKYTPSSKFKSFVTCFVMLKKMQKRYSARTQPCFTPLVMRMGSVRSPLSQIRPLRLSCSWITICRKLGGQPSRFRTSHSPVLLTESRGFVRLTKVELSPLFCLWHFSLS